jgi:hypothetical protein
MAITEITPRSLHSLADITPSQEFALRLQAFPTQTVLVRPISQSHRWKLGNCPLSSLFLLVHLPTVPNIPVAPSTLAALNTPAVLSTLASRIHSAASPLAQLVRSFAATSAQEDGPGPADSLNLSAASALRSPAPTQFLPNLHK